MAGSVPEVLVCLLAFIAGPAATTSTKQLLRGSETAHELLSRSRHSLTLRGENHHQAASLLAVTDDADDEAMKDQMRWLNVRLPKEGNYDMCNGNRYAWMANMMQKCQQMFGPESYWDRYRRPFCKTSFKQCRPYYGDCCAQPNGPTLLSTYCDLQFERKRQRDDPACFVQTKIQKLQDAMTKIPGVANRILGSKPQTKPVTSTSDPDPAVVRAISTESTVDDESYHDKGEAEYRGDTDQNEDLTGQAVTVLAQRGPPVGGIEAGPQVQRTVAKGLRNNAEWEESGPQLDRQAGTRRLHPEQWQRIFAPPSREVHCAELTHVFEEMSEAIGELDAWMTVSKGSKWDPGSMLNQDPELLRYIDNLITVGRSLQVRANACAPAAGLQEEDEYDNDDLEHSFLHSAMRSKEVVVDEFNRHNSVHITVVDSELKTRMDSYMGYITYISLDVLDIETQVHPHGDKWWRYHYEQTLLEAMFHIPLFIMFILLHRLVGYVSMIAAPHGTRPRFGRRVSTSNLFLHLSSSCLQNAAAVAIIIFTIWSINVATPLFDWFAVGARQMWESCNDHANSHCIFESVPFSGRSYYMMVTSIAMNLFGCCILYSLCVYEFLRVSTKFLDWLKTSEQAPCLAASAAEAQELQYFSFSEQLANIEKSDRLRGCAKAVGLDLDQNVTQEDLKTVKFHRFFVVSLDHAARDVVCWSRSLVLTLVVCCCLVAFFAGWKRLSFAWFMPGILIASFAILALAHLLKRGLWESTTKEKGEATIPWLSAQRWIVGVQIFLFILCYALSRFMLSTSIWAEHPWLTFYVFVGFAVLFSLARACISDLMVRMVCVLSLPPNAPTAVLEDYLEQMSEVSVDGEDLQGTSEI